MTTSTFLTTSQRLWLGFVVGITAFAVVIPLVADVEPTLPPALPAALAAAAGTGLVLAVRALDRIFAATPPADDAAARTEYRSRLLLQAVLAETAVLVAVVVTFVFGPGWVALIGGAAGLIALIPVRPSRARMQRFDEAWRRAGSEVSLVRAAGLDGDEVG